MKSMKINKVKNKGKVHPSPSSSSSSSSIPSPSFLASLPTIKDTETALNLLPATILALITILTLEEREVLAYMITRSIKSTTSNPVIQEKNTKKRINNKKQAVIGMVVMDQHKPPVFDCECFSCYTSYWFRWDSSPNRELIHQAIEGFEEHLASGEKEKEKNSGRGRRRERIGRRGNGKKIETEKADSRGKSENLMVPVAEEVDVAEQKVKEDKAEADAVEVGVVDVEQPLEPFPEPVVKETDTEMLELVVGMAEGQNHKGFARKVLPDVIGLLNSRFWNLLTPNA